MREILFRGKTKAHNKWVYGWYCGKILSDDMASTEESSQIIDAKTLYWHTCEAETVGQFTGVYDTELTKIFEGDIVRFLCYVCTVIFQDGCFGVALDIRNSFDWDYIDEEMKEYAGTNQITACFNDHFISLWEILWNFNCDQPTCNVVEVIGNIHDNPELLEVER